MAAALVDEPRRWSRVHTVWQRAAGLCLAPGAPVSHADRTTLELAGLLHDVGRAMTRTIFARMPSSEPGFSRRPAWSGVARLVAHHSGAVAEARLRGYVDG